MRARAALVFGFCLGIFLGTARAEAGQVRVFAASSLAESLKEIGAEYEKETGDKLVFNLAGSSTLARQIEAGAVADVFFPADEAQMNRLEQQGYIAMRRDRLANRLVVVAPKDRVKGIQSAADLAQPGVRRIALGNPAAVPAGVYAKAWLEKKGLWGAIEAKVVRCESARGALAAVASGNADAGVVYQTDALSSDKVRVVLDVPAEEAPRIVYPVGVLKGRSGTGFLDFLFSETAGEIFQRHGFSLIPAPPR